jgi:hypothetical protein
MEDTFESGGFWRKFVANKTAMVGTAMVIMAVLMTVFAPQLAPYDPYEVVRVTVDEIYAPPGAEHLLGTDDAGKDILSSFMYGARVSLIVGFFASLISIFIGGTIGILAGFYGGRVENILMSFTDIMLVIPDLPLMVLIVALTKPSLMNIIQQYPHNPQAYLPHGVAPDRGHRCAGHLPGYFERECPELLRLVRSYQDQLGADVALRLYTRGDERRGLVGAGDAGSGDRLAGAGLHFDWPGPGANLQSSARDSPPVSGQDDGLQAKTTSPGRGISFDPRRLAGLLAGETFPQGEQDELSVRGQCRRGGK